MNRAQTYASQSSHYVKNVRVPHLEEVPSHERRIAVVGEWHWPIGIFEMRASTHYTHSSAPTHDCEHAIRLLCWTCRKWRRFDEHL